MAKHVASAATLIVMRLLMFDVRVDAEISEVIGNIFYMYCNVT